MRIALYPTDNVVNWGERGRRYSNKVAVRGDLPLFHSILSDR